MKEILFIFIMMLAIAIWILWPNEPALRRRKSVSFSPIVQERVFDDRGQIVGQHDAKINDEW